MTVASLIGKAVAAGAPLLASALGSPLAGVAVSLIASAFGVKSDPDAILGALSSDPMAQVKLKEIEAQHQEMLAQIASNDFATAYQDRRDARGAARDGNYRWFVHLMAILVTMGFFGSVVMVFLTKADPGDHDILNTMLGVLGTTWVQVTSFYFGNIKKNYD